MVKREHLLSVKNAHSILFELHAVKSSTHPEMTEHLCMLGWGHITLFLVATS